MKLSHVQLLLVSSFCISLPAFGQTVPSSDNTVSVERSILLLDNQKRAGLSANYDRETLNRDQEISRIRVSADALNNHVYGRAQVTFSQKGLGPKGWLEAQNSPTEQFIGLGAGISGESDQGHFAAGIGIIGYSRDPLTRDDGIPLPFIVDGGIKLGKSVKLTGEMRVNRYYTCDTHDGSAKRIAVNGKEEEASSISCQYARFGAGAESRIPFIHQATIRGSVVHEIRQRDIWYSKGLGNSVDHNATMIRAGVGVVF